MKVVRKDSNNRTYSPCIASVEVASPPCVVDQQYGIEYLHKHYGGRLNKRSFDVIEKVFSNPNIQSRRLAFHSKEELVTLVDEDPDQRIQRYTHWATELSAQALEAALKKTSLSLHELTGLVVNTCTGYVCPGISTYLIEKLALPPTIKAYDLVGSGCGGAIPNLQLADGLLRKSEDEIIACISVEICSATYQMDNDISLIISNALFSDGAGAAILWNHPQGVCMIDSESYFDPKYRDAIRYVYKKGQLHNQLSSKLARIVDEKVAQTVTRLLDRHGLRIEDISCWALHSGGVKVIDAIQDRLNLSDKMVEVSRHILREYGNMSSATVWFELNAILNNGVAAGDWILMVSFGAGLSVHAYLFQA